MVNGLNESQCSLRPVVFPGELCERFRLLNAEPTVALWRGLACWRIHNRRRCSTGRCSEECTSRRYDPFLVLCQVKSGEIPSDCCRYCGRIVAQLLEIGLDLL